MLKAASMLSYPNFYYTVNNHLNTSNLYSNLKFYNKFEALRYKQSVPSSELYLNWFDEIWKTIDYTTEPQESLEELKRQRALKIRDNYKYIRLWFSGGVDSFSALNTFLVNNIHIDEIAYWSRPVNSYKFIDPDNEIKAATEPYLKKIQPLIPNTKIVPYKFTPQHLIDKARDMHNKGTNALISGKETEMEIVAECRDLYCSAAWSSGFVNLEGGIKPTLAKINEEWYFYINDRQMCLYDQFEDFFFDPEDPKLYLKTLHTFSKYIDSMNQTTEQLKEYSKKIDKYENKVNFLPHIGREHAFDKSSMIKYILPGNATPTVTVGNNKIHFRHVRVSEVMRAVKDIPEVQAAVDKWIEIINQYNFEFKQHINENIYGDPDAVLGFKQIFSKYYNLKNKNDFKWQVSNADNKINSNTVIENDIIRIAPS